MNIDIEQMNRCYKRRDISESHQSEWIFMIFQNSMFTRMKAIGIVYSLFTLISIVFYTLAVVLLTSKVPDLIERAAVKSELEQLKAQAGPMDQKSLQYMTKKDKLKSLEEEMVGTLNYVFLIFLGIQVLCYLNLMFFVQQLVSLVFIKKMGRDFTFPTT